MRTVIFLIICLLLVNHSQAQIFIPQSQPKTTNNTSPKQKISQPVTPSDSIPKVNTPVAKEPTKEETIAWLLEKLNKHVTLNKITKTYADENYKYPREICSDDNVEYCDFSYDSTKEMFVVVSETEIRKYSQSWNKDVYGEIGKIIGYDKILDTLIFSAKNFLKLEVKDDWTFGTKGWTFEKNGGVTIFLDCECGIHKYSAIIGDITDRQDFKTNTIFVSYDFKAEKDLTNRLTKAFVHLNNLLGSHATIQVQNDKEKF